MRTIWQDIRNGVRTLARSPGYAAVIVFTLSLGVGATTAIFSVVNGVLLRPLSYPQSDRLVCIQERISSLADKYPVLPVGARHFIEWRQRCTSFESLSLIDNDFMTLTGRGDPERLDALRVSANLFETLGVRPVMGRAFVAEEEEGANHVAIISDGLWRRTFGADSSILDATITLDGQPYTVVGVLPAAFRFPNVNPWGAVEMQTSTQPAVFVPKVFRSWERDTLIGGLNFAVIARLKEGIVPAQATAELNAIGAQIVDMAGQKDIELTAIVQPLKDALVRDSRLGLFVVLGAIGALLFIACLNLSILGLVRADRRAMESAVRAALGATRTRLLRQVFTEALLIAIPGTALGMVVASVGVETLVRVMPADLPRLGEVHIDAGALFFAIGLTGLTTILAAVLPALRTAKHEVLCVLKAGGRTATTDVLAFHLRKGLVVAEVGLAVMLLATAGLLLGSFARVMRADRGFDAPTVLAADLVPPAAKYSRWEARQAFYDRLLEHLASSPGVQSAAIINTLPLEGENWVSTACLPGDTRPEWERPMPNVRFASADYFRTMGIALLEGRTFQQTDRSRKVAVLSARLARALWPGQESVVGRKFLHGDLGEYEVIGVVQDVRANVDKEAVAVIYVPYWNEAMDCAVVVVGTTRDPLLVTGVVRAAIHSVDSDVPIAEMRTMREVLEESVSQRRFQMVMASAFALCAVFLAGLGIYSVVSYTVTRRTKEIGIRAAFGARSSDLRWMVLRQGMKPVLLGLISGICGALICGRVLQSLLYEVKADDPRILAVVAGVVMSTALAACYIPARRAARVDPMVALRCE
ncbi:MAG: ABC transporter permease [Phycisphaerae bacterium]|nr:ABC transporter permease [Phycisphaerae bacterium]